MTLKDYLALETSPTLTKLADDLGVSKGRLSQLSQSVDWPPDLAMKIEDETGGALNASFLSPVIARARQGLAA
jgi:DNA-binding transcriptional regulator YdaS (Cro superfamily)